MVCCLYSEVYIVYKLRSNTYDDLKIATLSNQFRLDIYKDTDRFTNKMVIKVLILCSKAFQLDLKTTIYAKPQIKMNRSEHFDVLLNSILQISYYYITIPLHLQAKHTHTDNKLTHKEILTTRHHIVI